MVTQLERLAKPFPDRLVHSNPSGGGSYVKHSVVTEKLLAVLGPFSFELVEVIRGDVAGKDGNVDAKSARGRLGVPALDGAIVGAVCRLTVEVDGRVARIEEVGDCEDPHNWPHDGARLKDAMSDSLKRAAMRLGVTLHLWSGPEFSLYDQLRQENAGGGTSAEVSRGSVLSDAEAGTPSATSPLLGESAGAGSSSQSRPPQDDGPAVSKARRETLKSKCVALNEVPGVSIADEREALHLPLVDSCSLEQIEAFEQMVDAIEKRLEAPFAEVPS